jgi:hypothetical protein
MLNSPDLHRALRDTSFALPSSPTVSRRRALAGLAAVLPAWTLLSIDDAEAGNKKKKRRRRRRRKKNKNKNTTPETNAFGCLNVGQPCNGDDDTCCSGICDGDKPKKGKKDTSTCAGHDANICQPGFDVCAGVIATCSNGGACFTTTGNAPFCAGGNGVCTVCTRDPDCVAAGFGTLAACVVCASECPETSGTVCFAAG